MDDLDRLRRHVAGAFVISCSGRIVRGPDRHLGPCQTSPRELIAGPLLLDRIQDVLGPPN